MTAADGVLKDSLRSLSHKIDQIAKAAEAAARHYHLLCALVRLHFALLAVGSGLALIAFDPCTHCLQHDHQCGH